ncbi:MAG: hypothetical protein ABF753_03480 [Lentilactobacillus hilgardii]|uniref:hypothetical protein n=2 Tax=Lentilactobacillus hilgardii TaxID=1588 RepID=UPI0039EAC4F4
MQTLCLLAQIQPTPPHQFMGFELGEWVEIIAIVTFIAGIIAWIVRIAIINPTRISNDALTESIKQLSNQVQNLGSSSERIHADHDKRLDDHEVHLARHDEEIKTLFNRTELDKKE